MSEGVSKDAGAKFITACLAPVSSGPEAFLADLKAEAHDDWHRGAMRVSIVNHLRLAAGDSLCLARLERHPDDVIAAAKLVCAEADRKYLAEIDRQMRVPAPSVRALRWKQDHSTYAAGRDAWDDAIRLDMIALKADLERLASRKKPRRKFVGYRTRED